MFLSATLTDWRTQRVSARDIDRLDATEGISVIKQKGLREIYLNLDSREDSPLFPGQKNPMSDPKVRQAMYLAIDESAIIKSIMNGCAFEMNSIVPEGYVGYKEVSREAYDPEKAKSLLLHTDASVTDIALHVCFNNTSYFIKKFQEANQLSPHKFRKKMS